MLSSRNRVHRLLFAFCVCCCFAVTAMGGDDSGNPDNSPQQPPPAKSETTGERLSLAEARAAGTARSRFKNAAPQQPTAVDAAGASPLVPQANLAEFAAAIRPILEQNCFDCHGPDASEGNIRIDTLNPDIVSGEDVDWWTEVFAVLSKGEMPPPADMVMDDDDRAQVVDWLSAELHTASVVRRSSSSHSAFRRLTRYEYNYALQDLLGLPWDFAKDLPPESYSEDGFKNSSELLHLSVSQFETYHRIARNALRRATAEGTRPTTRYWGVAMAAAAEREWQQQDAKLEKARKDLADDPDKRRAEIERLEK